MSQGPSPRTNANAASVHPLLHHHSPRPRTRRLAKTPLHIRSPSFEPPTDGPRFGQRQGRDRPTERGGGRVLRRFKRQLNLQKKWGGANAEALSAQPGKTRPQGGMSGLAERPLRTRVPAHPLGASAAMSPEHAAGACLAPVSRVRNRGTPLNRTGGILPTTAL